MSLLAGATQGKTRRHGQINCKKRPNSVQKVGHLPCKFTALHASPNRLRADALLLLRATGMRIGELIDLELDCVHDVPGAAAWVKVPLGKLDTRTDGAHRQRTGSRNMVDHTGKARYYPPIQWPRSAPTSRSSSSTAHEEYPSVSLVDLVGRFCLFTPTPGSWMNMVESSSGSSPGRRSAAASSTPSPNSAITRFIDAWNKNCHPFTWTKTADEILPHATGGQKTSFRRH